jgi:hypothetical protein
VRCPFGFEVGPENGPWICPRSVDHDRHDCHCTDCALMFAMGEIDDKIQLVVEFWRDKFQRAEFAWVPDIPEVPSDWP